MLFGIVDLIARAWAWVFSRAFDRIASDKEGGE